MGVGIERENGMALSQSPGGKPLLAQPEKKWALRRTLSLVLIISGVFWLIAGIAIRFLLF